MNEEKQVVENTSKQRFFNGRGRHFAIPKSCFVLFVLPAHEWKKLRKWIQKNDHVTIAPSSNGEVFLLNETELAKWRARKT
jgi:hypothetical protein